MKTLEKCKVGDILSYCNADKTMTKGKYKIIDEMFVFRDERVLSVGFVKDTIGRWLVFEDGTWLSVYKNYVTDGTFFVEEAEKPKKKGFVTDSEVGDIIKNGYSDVLVLAKIIYEDEPYLIVEYVYDPQEEYIVNSLGGYSLFEGFKNPIRCGRPGVFHLP